MKWITHPFIRPGTLESRTYQLSIAMRALDGNTMVVLPTGLGKTAIALIVAASRLYNEKGKVLMLAPTKPLVEQHYRFFRRYLLIDGKEPECALFTGESPPDERREAYSQAALIFATPQVIKNDLLSGAYTLADVTLLIVDECHRAVGNYAYVFIASVYRESARSPLLLAMTASPGGQEVKVEEVCHNLGIAIVETRTEQDTDVAPYVHERAIQVIEVDLPLPLKSAVEDLNELLEGRISVLKQLGFDVPKRQQTLHEKSQCAQCPYPGANPGAGCSRIHRGIPLCGTDETPARGFPGRVAGEQGARFVCPPAFCRRFIRRGFESGCPACKGSGIHPSP